MPVYQSDYVKPIQSDNPDYHSKFWEEFKLYPKEITGIRCKAKLIFCSDDSIEFDDNKKKDVRVECERTRCVFLLQKADGKDSKYYIDHQFWGRRRTKDKNDPNAKWGEWGQNSWDIQQLMSIVNDQKTAEEQATKIDCQNCTIYPEICGSIFTLVIGKYGEYKGKNGDYDRISVNVFYPDGRSLDEVELGAKEALDVVRALDKAKAKYQAFKDEQSETEAQPAYGSQPAYEQAQVAESAPAAVVELSAESTDDDDCPF